MKEAILIFLASLITLIITTLVHNRKTKAEAKLTEAQYIQSIIDIYKESIDELRNELKEARIEISKLRSEVKALSALNHKLECDLKAWKNAATK
jgi:peptidoglycan hydrolase CwlO-like protein